MLEPREADIPILILVLVVLPVVVYILLGKWSEASERRGRINFLSQMAAEDALRSEAIAASKVLRGETMDTASGFLRAETVDAASGIPVRVLRGKHVDAASVFQRDDAVDAGTCGIPVRVLSRKNMDAASVFQRDEAVEAGTCGTAVRVLRGKNVDAASVFQRDETVDAAATVVPVMARPKNKELHVCARCLSPAKTRCSRCKSVRYCSGECQVIHWRLSHKDECVPVESCSAFNGKVACEEKSASFGDNAPQVQMQERKSVGKHYRDSRRKDGVRMFGISGEYSGGEVASYSGSNSNSILKEGHTKHKSKSKGYAVEENTIRKSVGNSCMQANGQLIATSMQESYKRHSQHESDLEGVNKYGEHHYTESRWKGQAADLPKTVSGESPTMGVMKMVSLRKSTKLNTYEQPDDRHKKLKMLFPYEEFVTLFQSEVFDLSPRGLVNCGNSCYANAVLQALTCTKPLVVYLLQRSHSIACRKKDWCLICELEQHVIMLRENGGPLSASRILSHMSSINCQIGDGSQEDAHEFLRLLVASMQYICLERLGGESKVDPRLQETTLVQHIFGGRLRSKVKCLRCDQESERYENIMDLTLEIYGWVESLQDALTQFTTPEDLDGENMYRCSRCASYVRARKQLSIHETPNILTIVLKRFQEGRYGKINKCITFPEMLDMTPFMTRTGDAPPQYMLYAVVVHLDTLNASFSGHYISYVKDLRGNWFRIDDSEIHQVHVSQVMSEGAYMLFYMRSNPRDHNRKAQERHYIPRNETKPTSHLNIRSEAASYSDWNSLFTSSDEASFTTESTRDSFSDGGHSIFDNLYPSPQNTVACRMFSCTKPETRYFLEKTSHNNNNVVDSSSQDYPRRMYVN